MSPRSMLTSTGPALGSPRWAGDYLDRNSLIPGGAKIDPAQFAALDQVTVVVAAAGAALAATSVPLTTALTGDIPNGTVLWFGTTKSAQLTARALKGAVTLTVAPLPVALVSTDTATYKGVGAKYIPSGTLLGRTFAERDAFTPYGVPSDTDDEYFIVAFDISDASVVDDVELYRPNRIVYENFLPPDWAAASATVKSKIRGLYRCTIGAP